MHLFDGFADIEDFSIQIDANPPQCAYPAAAQATEQGHHRLSVDRRAADLEHNVVDLADGNDLDLFARSLGRPLALWGMFRSTQSRRAGLYPRDRSSRASPAPR